MESLPNAYTFLTVILSLRLDNPNAIMISGNADLENLTLSANISAFEGILPDFVVQGTGSFNLANGTGTLSVSQNQMIDGLGGWIFAGLDNLANNAADLTQMIEQLPIIGEDLAPGLRSALQSGFQFSGVDQGVRSYLENRGFTIVSVVTFEQLITGNLGTSDLIELNYSRQLSPDPVIVNFMGDLEFGPVMLELGGNLQVAPTLNYSVNFGLDLVGGPFLVEGASISVGLPVSGQVAGKARVGNLAQVDVSAMATMNLSAMAVLSDFDNQANERLYLISSRNRDEIHIDELLNGNAVQLNGTIDLVASMTVNNPAARIPVIGAMLPGSFTWIADVDYNLVTGEGSYEIRQDAAFQTVVDLFGNTEQALLNLALDRLDTYNPMPQNLRDFLTDDLPVLGVSLVDIVGLPEEAKLVLNPKAYKNKSADELNSNSGGDHITVNLDALEPANILKLLSGQEANLVSLDIEQTYSVDTSIPVFAAPVFSAFGVVNVDVAVNILAELGLKFDVVLGLDTKGFYVQASQGEDDYQVEVSGTVAGQLVGTGRIIVIPLVELTTDLGLRATGGIRLISQDDDKLRVNELLQPSNIEIGLGVDLVLNVDMVLGIPDLGLSAESHLFDKEFELYRANTSAADVGSVLSGIGDKLLQEAKRLALQALNPLAWVSEIGEQAVQAVNDAVNEVSEFVGETAQAVGEGLQNLADDGVAELNRVGGQAANLGKKALQVAEDLGNQVLTATGLSDFGSIFGTGSFHKVDVPIRRTFVAVVSGSTLTITAPDDHGFAAPTIGDFVISKLEDGKILVDAPNFTRNERVGYRKYDCWDGCNKKWVNKDYEHFNRQIFEAGQFTQIVVKGTSGADSIIVDSSITTPTTLYGYAGNDVLIGGSGDDRLFGGLGNDQLLGGAGHDDLRGEDDDDLLVGGDGFDELRGGSGNDVLDESQDLSGAGNYLDGGGDNDVLKGSTAADELWGGGGNDVLDGGSGSDMLDGQDGNDKLYGRAGNDSLYGGTGDDYLEGGDGNDYLDGQNDDDQLVGDNADGTGNGQDELHGGSGNDVLKGGGGADELYGDGGSDKLYGDGGNDLLIGGSSSTTESSDDTGDQLHGGADNDQLFGGRGDDMLLGGGGTDVLHGGSDADLLDGGAGTNTLYGDAGNDKLIESGNDTLYGGSGNDLLQGHLAYGDAGDDILSGTPGNDRLYGGSGNDRLAGLEGEDLLFGESGNDVLHGGSGHDQLSGGVGTDELHGEAGNDTLLGDAGNDTLFGGAGADELYGGSDQDVLEGGAGEDSLFGGSGSDTLRGGSENDLLRGGTEDDYLYGGGGGDRLYGDEHNDELYGEAGEDTLTGGSGNDTLDGGADDDYLLGGDGDDTAFGGLGSDTILGGWGADTLAGGVTTSGGGNTSDVNTIYGDFESEGGAPAGNHGDTLYGDVGIDFLYGTEGDDLLFGNAGNDELVGGSGSDQLDGMDGEDLLLGGTGPDELYGGGGNDVIRGEDDDDFLSGGPGDDQLWGGVGADHLQGDDGNDNLFGESGADILEGGWGQDNLYGGDQDDVLYGEFVDVNFAFPGNPEDHVDRLFGDDGDDQLFGASAMTPSLAWTATIRCRVTVMSISCTEALATTSSWVATEMIFFMVRAVTMPWRENLATTPWTAASIMTYFGVANLCSAQWELT